MRFKASADVKKTFSSLLTNKLQCLTQAKLTA